MITETTALKIHPLAKLGEKIRTDHPDHWRTRPECYLEPWHKLGDQPSNNNGTITLFATLASYDTIRFFIPGMRKINHNLTESFHELVDTRTGEISSISKFRNLTIREKNYGVSIEGSLPTFLNCHNLTPISLTQVKQAIEEISDILHVDVFSGTARRVDIAANLIMERKVGDYLLCLSSSPRCQRRLYSNKTLNLWNDSKTLTFYDKHAQLRKADGKRNIFIRNLLSQIESFNILRYEYQSKKIDNLFNHSPSIKCLLDRHFFIKMLDTWKRNYDSIVKSKFTFSNIEEHADIRELNNYVLLAGVENIGGFDCIMEHLENRVVSRKNSRPQKSRFKMKMKAICEKGSELNAKYIVEELNLKIQNVYQNTLESVNG